MGVEEHREKGAADFGTLRCAVITVSDTRTLETDSSGKGIVAALEGAGHVVARRVLVRDEPVDLKEVLLRWLEADVECVLLNGGTGISARDGTVDVVRDLLDKELEGFGELFRWLSYEQVGAAAMLSRALGGIARGKVVFALPGSRGATRLALEKLILPELPHLVHEIKKQG